jgi:hypothetical protein
VGDVRHGRLEEQHWLGDRHVHPRRRNAARPSHPRRRS